MSVEIKLILFVVIMIFVVPEVMKVLRKMGE